MIRGVLLAACDRETRCLISDYLVVALAISLPWSTTATGILVGMWLISRIPNLAMKSSWQVFLLPAAALPMFLVLAAILGMFWAHVPWSDRLGGMSAFFKLISIPLLMAQFATSRRARMVMMGFIVSCVILAGVSWLSFFWPSLFNRSGIVVKNYITQGAMLTVCVFLLAPSVTRTMHERCHGAAVALLTLELILVLNILFIAASRTYLIVFPAILAGFGFRAASWKGVALLVGSFIVISAAAFPFSSFLRSKVYSSIHQLQIYNPESAPTSEGERLIFWTKSLEFMRTAPLLGHGTGSIREQFRRAASGSGMSAEVSDNPHNQILAVGIELGAIGVILLLMMWVAHALLFNWNTLSGWAGFVIVSQNVLGSLFNSHLFDFTEGWLYVVGVGVAGGVVIRRRLGQRRGDRGSMQNDLAGQDSTATS